MTTRKWCGFAGTCPEMSGNVTKMSARSIGRVLEESPRRGQIPCKDGGLRRIMDNFGHLAQHVVRGVYFSGGSGCSVGQRAMPDLAANRRWRSGGQVRAVRPCRRQPRRGDLDRSEDGAIIGASPGHWDGGRQRNVSGGSRRHVGRNANAIARSGPASREGAPRQSTLRCSSASKGRTAARCWIRRRGEVCCNRFGASESAACA
jgi:hypothetical protein